VHGLATVATQNHDDVEQPSPHLPQQVNMVGTVMADDEGRSLVSKNDRVFGSDRI
jgi:hypothetical protein